MSALFTAAMTLREVGSGADGLVFEGALDERWTIGPKVHGGVMVALCANAARTAYGGDNLHPWRSPRIFCRPLIRGWCGW